MLNTVVVTAFEDMTKAYKVAIGIRQQIFEGITHAGLSC